MWGISSARLYLQFVIFNIFNDTNNKLKVDQQTDPNSVTYEQN